MSREELPKALATWYDYTKWVLDRVDGFPKNQRFVLVHSIAWLDTFTGTLPAYAASASNSITSDHPVRQARATHPRVTHGGR